MNKNPLLIQPGTFFICGHDATTNGKDNRSNFIGVEKMLTEEGIKCVNPYGMPLEWRIAHLATCDTIICLADWERWENSVKEMNVAKTMGKQITPAWVVEARRKEVMNRATKEIAA